jgi:hypothetical protein
MVYAPPNSTYTVPSSSLNNEGSHMPLSPPLAYTSSNGIELATPQPTLQTNGKPTEQVMLPAVDDEEEREKRKIQS